jgi:hypothetical protein
MVLLLVQSSHLAADETLPTKHEETVFSQETNLIRELERPKLCELGKEARQFDSNRLSKHTSTNPAFRPTGRQNRETNHVQRKAQNARSRASRTCDRGRILVGGCSGECH